MFLYEYSFLGKSEEPKLVPPTWEPDDLAFYKDHLRKIVTSLTPAAERLFRHYGFIEPVEFVSFDSFCKIVQGNWDVEIEVYSAGDFW